MPIKRRQQHATMQAKPTQNSDFITFSNMNEMTLPAAITLPTSNGNRLKTTSSLSKFDNLDSIYQRMVIRTT